jgi:hypothetical protein
MDDSRQSRPAVRVGQIWQRNEYLDGRPWPGQGYVMIAYTTPTMRLFMRAKRMEA